MMNMSGCNQDLWEDDDNAGGDNAGGDSDDSSLKPGSGKQDSLSEPCADENQEPVSSTPFGQISLHNRITVPESDTDMKIPRKGVFIGDRYHLRRRIGEGGMGIVFEAMDSKLKRKVAVKFLHPRLRVKGYYDKLFYREAVAMAAVRHECVVTIHDYGSSDYGPYFIMEFVSGVTAAELLDSAKDQSNQLTVEKAMEITGNALKGLGAVHRAGVIHRDVKPSNIIVTAAPKRIALMDFGLGLLIKDGDDKMKHGGTPSYLAPEVLGLADIDPDMARRTDIFSMGVAAYELFTCELPFGTGSWIEVFTRQQKQHPKLPSQVRPELPHHLDQVLMTALAKDPVDRFASCSQFLGDLTATLSSKQRREKKHIPTLMVVDDDPDFRLFVTTAAKASVPDCRIISASDGSMAMDMVEKNRPDAMLVDIRMPGMNGVELCGALKGDESTKDLEIVVITAAGGAPEREMLKTMGITRFLNKPLDPVHFSELLREILIER